MSNRDTLLNKQKQYYSGIDILKIFAMFLVTVLHVTGLGGTIDAAVNPITKLVLCSMEGISFSCINLFALSTGFLCYGKKSRFSRLFSIWLQVIFWAVFANIGPALYLKDFSILTETPFVRLFVVSFCTYWYFTAYFALFFFIPLLNYAIEKISEKHFTALLISVLVIFGVLPFLFNNDLFVTQKGYSFVWLSILYLLGAGFKKFRFTEKIKTGFLVFIACVSAAAQSVITFVSQTWNITFMGVNYSEMYEKYNFIIVLLLSISLFLLISKINIKNTKTQKFIRTLSSAAFSVYLIQCNPSMMRTFMENKYGFIGYYSPIKAAAAVLGISLIMYIVYSVLGILQNNLFKLLRINKLFEKLETLLNKIFDFAYNKIFCRCVKDI